MHFRLACLIALMLATFVIQRVPSSDGEKTPHTVAHVICDHHKLQAANSPEALSHAWFEVLDNWDALHHQCRVFAGDIMREKTTLFQKIGHSEIYIWRFPKTSCQLPKISCQLEAIRNGGRVFVPRPKA